ncbi:MAG TPA: aminotransferase class IV [Thermoguttaceae bacterium]|nr:aminotransferase class IV [Thermoguttaceae bacterium]
MAQQSIVYLNGRMVASGEAHLNIYDLGVVLGATVSEMARTFRHRLFRLEGHLRRLARSLEYVGFDAGVSIARLAEIAEEVVEHNGRLIGAEEELGLVVFITAGESVMYAGADATTRREPTVCVHTFPMPFHAWAAKMRDGARVVTPSIRHVPPQCFPAAVKHRSRVNYYLAEREAQAVDPEAIPLLLDLQGNVAETNTANFLIVEDGTIVSPTLANILPGISREMAAELAVELGIPFAERDFDAARVAMAEEALLVSTPYCIMPAVRINGKPIGEGRPGVTFRRLIDAWSGRVGVDVYRQVVENILVGDAHPTESQDCSGTSRGA